MFCRTISAFVRSSVKFTSKKNLPPTVTKENSEGGSLGWLMKRTWPGTADVQCPLATVEVTEILTAPKHSEMSPHRIW